MQRSWQRPQVLESKENENSKIMSAQPSQPTDKKQNTNL